MGPAAKLNERDRCKIENKNNTNNVHWYQLCLCCIFFLFLDHPIKRVKIPKIVCLFCDGIKRKQKVSCWPYLKWWHIKKCTKHFAELIQWYWRSVTSHLCWHTDCWCRERLTWQLSTFIVWGISPDFTLVVVISLLSLLPLVLSSTWLLRGGDVRQASEPCPHKLLSSVFPRQLNVCGSFTLLFQVKCFTPE